MALGMPSINITFNQLAATAVARSARGIVALVVKDTTSQGLSIAEFTRFADVDKTAYTADNYKAIQQCFDAAPYKVIVCKVTANSGLATALDGIYFNWVCFASNTEGDQAALVSYVKSYNNSHQAHKIKALVYKAAGPDDIHIVNLSTDSFIWAGTEATVTGDKLLPRLAGVLAAMPMSRSATYYKLPDIASATEPADMDNAVDEGKLFLFNDEGTVRISRAVNSLVTTTAKLTEDMKSICIVESMDMILEDCYKAFKDYIGAYKNLYDYQALYIAAVNGYFKQLSKEDVLDRNYNNHAEVDIEAQRDAWLAAGKAEAAEWDDITVKNNTFKREVFLRADVKMLDAMEDLKFDIYML